ncbi:MAG: hypothetical protein ABIQ60_10545 [Burkholderiaceae bacterium]
MLYLAHFSFSFEDNPRKKNAQAWHGYFTAVAEAKNVAAVLTKFEALVIKSAESSELFADVKEIFLESCIELKTTPRAGFLAHVALEEGESLGSISTTLPGLNDKYATSFHFEPEMADKDGGFDAEPFVVMKKVKATRPAPKAAAKAPAKPAAKTPAKAAKKR